MTLANNSSRMWPDENWVGINVVITDDDRPDLEPLGPGAKVVVNQIVKRQYVSGQDMPNKTRDEIGNEAQKLIEDYKALITKYDNPVYIIKTDQIIGALTL